MENAKIKKIHYLYFFFLTLITILTLIFIGGKNPNFTQLYNVIFGIFTIIIFSLITIKTFFLYKKTSDKRVAILFTCFLWNIIFQTLHIMGNSSVNAQFIYWYVGTFIVLSSLLCLIIYHHNPIAEKPENFFNKINLVYFVFAFFSILILHFNAEYLGIVAISLPLVSIHAALYILLVVILADIRLNQKLPAFTPFLLGIILLAISDIFHLSFYYNNSFYKFIIHFLNIYGYSLILTGIDDMLFKTNYFSIKEKLLLYNGIFISVLYLLIITYSSFVLGFDFRVSFDYMFFTIFLIMIISFYLLTAKITFPISNIINGIIKNKPGEKLTLIPIISNDEIGNLTTEFNKNAKLVYDYTLKEKQNIKTEQLLREIIESIRSSLDFEETFSLVCEETAKLFNVQRVAVTKLPNLDNLSIFETKNEYKVSDDIESFGNRDDASKTAAYWGENFIKVKSVIAFDNIETSDAPDYFKNNYRQMGVKSIIGVDIKKGKDFWGGLILSEYNDYRHWTNEEKILLKIISDQMYIAIKQAELYSTTKQQAERERALRNLTNTIRSSLNLNQIKRSFVNEIGRTLNMDRTVFVEYDSKLKKFLPVTKYSEYLMSNDVKSMTDLDIEEYEFFNKAFMEGKEVIVQDYKKFIEENNLKGTTTEKYIEKYDVKSGIGIPIRYLDQLFGRIILHHTKQVIKFSQEEIGFIRTISSQAGMALYQAKLYESINAQVKREALLRRITEIIRSSLDIDETLSFICEETTKLFNVQRSAIGLYQDFKDYKNFKLRKDYATSPEVKMFSDIKDYYIVLPIWEEELINKKQILSIDNIMESSYPDYFKDAYISIGVKSLLGTAIMKGNEIWGTLVLSEYNEYRCWTDEDKILLKSIADQVYIAITQAELFENEKKIAQKEVILRDVINKIRSSIDIQQIKHEMVNQIGMFLNANAVFFSDYSPETGNYVITKDAEYRVPENLKSRVNLDFKNISGFTEHIRDVHLKGNDIIFDDLEKYLDDKNIRGTGVETFYREYNVMSSAAINIYHGDVFLGNLVITFKEKRHISDYEMEFIRTLADQAGIAIYQAKLYEKEKLAAEREKISKNIIEILRSSMEKQIIKKMFVKNIGKLLDADRVFFSDYSSNNKMYLPVDEDSEYLSNKDEKSFIGFDWSNPDIQERVQPLIEKREIKIPDIEEYLRQNPNLNLHVNDLYVGAGVKSSYSFPVLHQIDIIGYFCIEFTQKICKLSDEEINRIRSICTQAGIALYQADLYNKAREVLAYKGKFVTSISQETKKILENILELSNAMSQTEFQCEEHIKYLNHIKENIKLLMDLTNNLLDDSESSNNT